MSQQEAPRRRARLQFVPARRERSTQDAQVAVVGLGVMGACTLWQLARRGICAVGVEQHESPHALGSSHGETRIIRFAMFEGALYGGLVRQALPLWRELERDTQVGLLRQCGVLLIDSSSSPDSIVSAAARTMQSLDLPFQTLSGAPAARRFPQHVIRDGEHTLYDPGGGVLKAEGSVVAALANARERGATVLSSSPVTTILADPHGVTVQTAHTTLRVQHVVVAVGAWLTEFLPSLSAFVAVERHLLGWFKLGSPDLYTSDRCPVFIRRNVLYGFPSQDGGSVKVGFQTEGQPANLLLRARRVPDQQLHSLYELAVHEHLHGVEGAVPGTGLWCLYTLTSDNDFIVDRLTPQVSILGGFSGHGFKHAPALAAMAAEMASSDRDPAVPRAFRLSRFGRVDSLARV